MSDRPVILIVDDDEDLRDTIVEVLTDEGYAVAQAPNGAAALTYLAAHPDTGLVIVDLMMPIMDGEQFRAYQRINPEIADIPVVFLSAGQKEHFRSAASGARVMWKPVSITDLLAVVAAYTPPPPPR